MMNLKYLIIDDEPLAHKLIENFASKLDSMQLIANCHNAMEAAAVLEDVQVDLIFLDINMPMVSGFEFLKSLEQQPHIIIISAHREYALESYEYEISDYLLKPFNFERFHKAVEKVTDMQALKFDSHNSKSHIYIKDDKKHHKVPLDNIIYIKANGNYTSVFLSTGSLISQMKISEFETLLPQPPFYRVHRSYIISQDAITLVRASKIVLKDVAVPVGRVYKDIVNKLLLSN